MIPPVTRKGDARDDRARQRRQNGGERGTGEAVMADRDLADTNTGAAPATAEDCFELGMIHASGRDGAVDLVTAHKWFNIAAARGHQDAARQRREIAGQMADAEIGTAQRAARDWLTTHPVAAAAPAPVLRIAA